MAFTRRLQVASHSGNRVSLLMPGRWIRHLKPCSSQARRISSVQRRHPPAHIRPLRGNDLGPTREDVHQTFRARKDGSLKELPLPPLLDPVVLDNRSRFEHAKKRPNIAELTPFQKKLWHNPFGRRIHLLHREASADDTQHMYSRPQFDNVV
jgi:hypothetical protein